MNSRADWIGRDARIPGHGRRWPNRRRVKPSLWREAALFALALLVWGFVCIWLMAQVPQ